MADAPGNSSKNPPETTNDASAKVVNDAGNAKEKSAEQVSLSTKKHSKHKSKSGASNSVQPHSYQVKLFANPADAHDNHYFVVDNLSTKDVKVNFASDTDETTPNNLAKENSFKVKAGKRKTLPVCKSGLLTTGWSFLQYGSFRFDGRPESRKESKVHFAVKNSGTSMMMRTPDLRIGLCSLDKLLAADAKKLRKGKYSDIALDGLSFQCQLWEDKEAKSYYSWHFIIKDSFQEAPKASKKRTAQAPKPPLQYEQCVILVNHAARLDAVDEAWSKMAARPQDPPLASVGHKQATKLGKWLKTLTDVKPIDRFITAPEFRCVQTANAVAREFKAPFGSVFIEQGLCDNPKFMKGAMEPFFLHPADLCVASHRIDCSAKTSLHATTFARGSKYPGPPVEAEGFKNRCRAALEKVLNHKLNRRKTIVLVASPATTWQWLKALSPKAAAAGEGEAGLEDSAVTILTRKSNSTKWKLLGIVGSTLHLGSDGNEAQF